MTTEWMGSVFPRGKNGRLYVCVKDAGGDWKQMRTPFFRGDEAQARRFVRQWKDQLLGGKTIRSPELSGKVTVRQFGPKWLENRREVGIADVENDEGKLRNHIYPAIGNMLLDDVRPQHIAEIILELRRSGHAPRTVRNVYSAIRCLFRDAEIAGLTTNRPCILTWHQLGKLHDKKLGWRSKAVFTRDELVALVTDPRVPEDRRVLYALLGIAMLRHGEGAGLRWVNTELETKPLGKILVVTSYLSDWTKTRVERWMPIHPFLAEMLRVWKGSGWARVFGRLPREDDLVVPVAPEPARQGPTKTPGGLRDKNFSWKRLKKDLETLGLRHRRIHDLRRTGISLARADGADKHILKRGTHAPPRDVMELYTSVDWDVLCRETLKWTLSGKEANGVAPGVVLQLPRSH